MGRLDRVLQRFQRTAHVFVLGAVTLKAFPVLPGLDGLTVLADHDKPKPRTGIRAGHDAALAVVERYTRTDISPERDLRIILPPTEGEDAADLEVTA